MTDKELAIIKRTMYKKPNSYIIDYLNQSPFSDRILSVIPIRKFLMLVLAFKVYEIFK